jgi:hypothetical protein
MATVMAAAWYDRVPDLLPWAPVALAWAAFGLIRSGLRQLKLICALESSKRDRWILDRASIDLA